MDLAHPQQQAQRTAVELAGPLGTPGNLLPLMVGIIVLNQMCATNHIPFQNGPEVDHLEEIPERSRNSLHEALRTKFPEMHD
jgi:hypothetical protein